MLIKRPGDIKSSEITPESVWRSRRRFLAGTGAAAAASVVPGLAFGNTTAAEASDVERTVLRHLGKPSHRSTPAAWHRAKVNAAVPGAYYAEDDVTPYDYVTQYNNFYEFGTSKGDPYANAQDFRTDPWSVEVTGHAEKTGRFALEDLINPHQLEERIYRFRCVEAWSMVVPWIGVPLASILKPLGPTSKARYVRMETLHDPKRMPGQRGFFSSIDWPYVEGLRIDEAMHDLTFMALGVFGETMPPQNGAPLRLVVPWKYGFKSVKSIVKIEFVERQPKTTWELANAREYGFYSNVNPEVDHPRWSQATERRLPSTLFSPNRIDTLMFNGYGDQVASLYAGMDLRRQF